MGRRKYLIIDNIRLWVERTVLRPPHWTLRARWAQGHRDQFLRKQERPVREGARQDSQGLGQQGDRMRWRW